jgi:hypothetical protein
MTLGSVPLAPYATTGTDEVAAILAALTPKHEAILMANHGAVTYGSSLLDAFLKMGNPRAFRNDLFGSPSTRLCSPIETETGRRTPSGKGEIRSEYDGAAQMTEPGST